MGEDSGSDMAVSEHEGPGDAGEPDAEGEDDAEHAEAEHADDASPHGPYAADNADGPTGMGPGVADFGDEDDDSEPYPEGGPGIAGTTALAPEDLKGALEALILVSDKPVPAMRLARLTRQDLGVVRRALAEIADDYRGRGIGLDEIAGGYQFRTSPRFAPFVRMLVQQKPTRLSRAQLEVLAIIAYRQPVTRPEIDDVRGVDSGSALKILLERNVIKIIGKKDEAGRPMLYATSSDFLELFGLNTLRDLPTLREFAELTAESRDMFERRIGEPLPGQGQGMDMSTHYEAPAHSEEPDADAEEAGREPTNDDTSSAAREAGTTEQQSGTADAQQDAVDADYEAPGSEHS